MPEFKGTKAIRNTGVYTTAGPRTTDPSKVDTPSMGRAPRNPVGADNRYVAASPTKAMDALAEFKDTTKMHKSHGGRVIRKGW